VKYIGGLRHNTAQQTDERVRLTSEAIHGILAAKMLCEWLACVRVRVCACACACVRACVCVCVCVCVHAPVRLKG
jgi:hypothetical protein